MKNLPEELILEILLRLPVKSLLRFKAVCKSWLSLISNPQFAKSHLDLAAVQTSRIFLVTDNEVRSVDFEASFHDVSASAKLNFPLSFSNVEIRGSCRGFLLLDIVNNFFVYNPSTGVCRRISYPPISSSNIVFNKVFHGISFDASKDDYLVVLGSYYIELHWEFIITQIEIFSFKTNSWKTIEGTHFPYINALNEPRAGLLLNEALHWIAFRYEMLEDIIVAFDFIEEKSRELPLPQDFTGSLYHSHIAVLGGCLSLCSKEGDTNYIWIMKEYGVQSSWSKSVVLSLAGTTLYYISPICSTKGGGIVGKDGNLELVKFSHRGDLLEHRPYSDIRHCCKAVVYTESLLSLPNGTEEGGQDLQQRWARRIML